MPAPEPSLLKTKQRTQQLDRLFGGAVQFVGDWNLEHTGELTMRNHPKHNGRITIGQHDINLWNEQTRTYEHHRILVEVDSFEIAKQMGKKAIISKARKSKCVGGAIVVTDVLKIS